MTGCRFLPLCSMIVSDASCHGYYLWFRNPLRGNVALHRRDGLPVARRRTRRLEGEAEERFYIHRLKKKKKGGSVG